MSTNLILQQFSMSIFEVKDDKINLTKICQHFNKRLDVWLKAKSTQRFLDAYKLTPNGGTLNTQLGKDKEQVTFGDRKIALKLAQWISPEFEVFCTLKLDTLFTTSTVSLFPSSTSLSERILKLLFKSSLYGDEARDIREEMELQRRVAGNCYKLDHNTITTDDIMKRLKIKPNYRQALIECLAENGYKKINNKYFGVECMFW